MSNTKKPPQELVEKIRESLESGSMAGDYDAVMDDSYRLAQIAVQHADSELNDYKINHVINEIENDYLRRVTDERDESVSLLRRIASCHENGNTEQLGLCIKIANILLKKHE